MSNPTLRRLEVFAAIVEEGTFRAAADRFGIAQPSVSEHIEILERDFGGRLFDRQRGRKPALTELGKGVLANVRQLLAEATDMRSNAVQVQSSSSERVVLSCQRSLANFALKPHIREFALAHPNIQFVARIGTQEDVIEEVQDGTADVGCFLSNDETRGLRSEVIGYERLVLFASAMHPLATRRNVKPAEIMRYDFVGPPPSSMFGRAIFKLLASVDIPKLRIVTQATEYQFLRDFLVSGSAISCSLARNVESDVENGTLAILDFGGPELTLQVRQLASSRRAPSPATARFMEFLRSKGTRS